MTDFSSDIEHCLRVLDKGGVILYPTDTIWGLGCDATNPVAVQKLVEIKGKPANKGLIVLLASERDILQYVAAPDPAVFDFLDNITKPTTVIYEHGLNVADEVLNEDGSIAIRVVKEDFCRHLLKRFKKPIVSTSANIHGQPSPQNFADTSTEIKNAVDYVVSFGQELTGEKKASAILKWKKGEAIVVRP